MQADKEDIELEQYCAECGGDLMVSLHEGWKVIVQHVDAELESDHNVTGLTTTKREIMDRKVQRVVVELEYEPSPYYPNEATENYVKDRIITGQYLRQSRVLSVKFVDSELETFGPAYEQYKEIDE